MVVLMAVNLYTVRIVLNELGVTNFGIYNVVGSMVLLFNFLNDSLSSATQRFLAFELGKGSCNEICKVFSVSIFIHAIVALVVLIFSETIGLWFLHNKMSIPGDRMYAAEWVYHFSVCASIISILRVPYNALIIAHEQMVFYSYIGIIEALLKLVAVYLLVIVALDKLITYSTLVAVISVLIILISYIYCIKKYPLIRFRPTWDMLVLPVLL